MKEKLKKLYRWSNTWTGTIVIVLLIIFFLAQAFIIPSGSMKNTLLPGDALFAEKFAYGIPIPHIPWLEIPVLPDFRGDGHLIDGPRPKRGDIVIFRYPLDIKEHFVKRCFAVSGDEVIYNQKGFWLHPHQGNAYVKEHYKGDVIKNFDGKLFVLNPLMKKHKGIHYADHNDVFNSMMNLRAKQIIEFANLEHYTGFVPYSKIKKIVHQMLGALALQGINAKPNDIDIGMGMYLKDGKVQYYYLKLPKDWFFMAGDNRDNSDDSRFWGPVPYKLIVGKPWFIYMSWNSHFTIRWNRVGKTVAEIERELDQGKKPYLTAGCQKGY